MLISLANLVRLLLTIYMWLIVIRAVISWVNPSPYNKFVRILARITDPVLYNVRRLFPVSYGGIDFSPVILILLIVFINDFIVTSMIGLARGMPASSVLPIFIISAIRLLQGLLFALMILLVIRAVLSWISPDPYNPIVRFIYGVSEPLLNPIRRMLPLVYGGIDFSPVLLITVIYLLNSGLDRLMMIVGGSLF